MLQLCDLRALLVDMDGVLYRGATPIPGAPAFLAWLTERGLPYLLVTNNSTLDTEACALKLARMGFDLPACRILTSGMATADYVVREYGPATRVYAIGERGLQHSLAERGLTLTDEAPQVVVVGLDRQLTYAQLRTATLAIRAGAHFVATNPDRTLPTEAGQVPGAGAVVAAVAAASDQVPVVIGKPEPPLLEMAVRTLGQPPEHTAVLGDRLDTDIAGASRLGLPSILVLSGVVQAPPSPGSAPQPTWVYPSVQELRQAWQQSLGER